MNQIIPRHCRNWIPIGIQCNRVKEWNLKKDEEEKKWSRISTPFQTVDKVTVDSLFKI